MYAYAYYIIVSFGCCSTLYIYTVYMATTSKWSLSLVMHELPSNCIYIFHYPASARTTHNRVSDSFPIRKWNGMKRREKAQQQQWQQRQCVDTIRVCDVRGQKKNCGTLKSDAAIYVMQKSFEHSVWVAGHVWSFGVHCAAVSVPYAIKSMTDYRFVSCRFFFCLFIVVTELKRRFSPMK